MEAKKGYRDFLRKFIKFITFVDQPINSKFILFSMGVVLWFLLMFVVSLATNRQINSSTDRIVHEIMPYEKTVQKITGKLQELQADIAAIEGASDAEVLDRRIELTKAKIADIASFISALKNGGQVNDIDRNSNTFMEAYTVRPLDIELYRKHVDGLSPFIAGLQNEIDRIAGLKRNMPGTSGQDSIQLAEAIKRYRQLLSDSLASSNSLYGQMEQLYLTTSEKIRNVTRINFYTSAAVLVMATLLLAVFTYSISRSLARPIRSIIDQIRGLSDGSTDFSQRVKVRSKDEIGTLSRDFNDLLDEIQEMNTFKKIIEEDDSLEDVYSRLGKIFSDRFGMDDFIIYEINNSQNKMRPVYPLMLNEREIYCNTDMLANCNLCKVKKTGRLISSAEYPNICKQFRSDIDRVHVCIPMVIGGTTGGVVMFLFDRRYYSPAGTDIRIFKYEQYIKESLSVIEAKRLMSTLRESALKDALTGLYNRRFLQEYTETLISGSLRRKKAIGLVMCDLDYFKQVNDVYGHNIGDKILKETSEIIRNCVRNSDLVIRFGGEEFLALLIDVNEGDSVNIAEKIRKAIEERKIKVTDGTIKKTISLGVSEFPIDTESFWQAIKFSDVALYKAKEAGRNRVVRFTKDMWTEEAF